jgi:hypothetical protein
MKAKTGGSGGSAGGNGSGSSVIESRPRNTTGGSDKDITPTPSLAPPTSSSPAARSGSAVEGRVTEEQSRVEDEINLRRQERLKELENKKKPDWMRTAAERTSRVATTLQTHKGGRGSN